MQVAVFLSSIAFAVAGCTSGATTAGSSACDDAGFLAVQRAHVNHAEVTLCGTVVRVGPALESRSGRHRTFIVDVGGGDDIEIDANLDEMSALPIDAGERAVVRGEYYYDGGGREGIHWTHHTGRGYHPSGYVILNGTTYR